MARELPRTRTPWFRPDSRFGRECRIYPTPAGERPAIATALMVARRKSWRRGIQPSHGPAAAATLWPRRFGLGSFVDVAVDERLSGSPDFRVAIFADRHDRRALLEERVTTDEPPAGDVTTLFLFKHCPDLVRELEAIPRLRPWLRAIGLRPLMRLLPASGSGQSSDQRCPKRIVELPHEFVRVLPIRVPMQSDGR